MWAGHERGPEARSRGHEHVPVPRSPLTHVFVDSVGVFRKLGEHGVKASQAGCLVIVFPGSGFVTFRENGSFRYFLSHEFRKGAHVNILITIDEGYIEPFKTLAKSVMVNNRGEYVRFLLVHSSIDGGRLSALHAFCTELGADFAAIRVSEDDFGDAPTTKRYPLEVYYRLLAPHVLPSSIERVIYLDCDMLVVNSLKPLWELDLQGNAFAAASHSDEVSAVDAMNQLRLDTDHAYFNTGLIVMDTARARGVMTPEKLYECIDELGKLIVLPDQDVFNAVCGECTLPLDDEVWNYDVRKFPQYLAASLAEHHDAAWVMEHTAVLHFCGRLKPWRKSYAGRFGMLYRHYMNLARR